MTDAGPFVQAVYGREIEKKKEERGGGTDTLFLPVQIRHSALFVSYLPQNGGGVAPLGGKQSITSPVGEITNP
jgi:hypothetical protein